MLAQGVPPDANVYYCRPGPVPFAPWHYDASGSDLVRARERQSPFCQHQSVVSSMMISC
jgi:hypothetical protein